MSNKWVRNKTGYKGKLPQLKEYVSRDGVEGVQVVYNKRILGTFCFANMQTNYRLAENCRLRFVKKEIENGK